MTSSESSSAQAACLALGTTVAELAASIAASCLGVRRARPPVDVHVAGAPHLPDDLADDRHRAGQQAPLLAEAVEREPGRGGRGLRARPDRSLAGAGGERDGRVAPRSRHRILSSPPSFSRISVLGREQVLRRFARHGLWSPAGLSFAADLGRHLLLAPFPYTAVCPGPVERRSRRRESEDDLLQLDVRRHAGALQPAIRTKKPSGTTPRAFREGGRRARGIQLAQVTLVV